LPPAVTRKAPAAAHDAERCLGKPQFSHPDQAPSTSRPAHRSPSNFFLGGADRPAIWIAGTPREFSHSF
jgi:hypothetical protein